jgi:hypothetical protein
MLKAKIKKYLSYLFRFLIAAGALYLAFRGEDIREVTKILLKINLWVFAAALGLYIISQLIFVARWSLLLKAQSVEIGFWPAVMLLFLGLFYNNCLPSAVGKLQAALSVFVDRVIGLTGMLLMAFFFYWFIPAENRKGIFDFPFEISFGKRLVEYRWVIAGIAAAFVVVILGFLLREKGRLLLRRAAKFIVEISVKIISKTAVAIKLYCTKGWTIIAAFLLTFCCQGVFIIAVWLMGREIGVTASVKYYFIFFSLSWLLSSLPISVGGAGITEWWLKVMFVKTCGLPGEYALALALCQRILWLVGSLPGVVIHLMGAHLPKDFFIDYEKPAN